MQIHRLILGLDVLGNPVKIVRGVVEGTFDLFYEPIKVITFSSFLSPLPPSLAPHTHTFSKTDITCTVGTIYVIIVILARVLLILNILIHFLFINFRAVCWGLRNLLLVWVLALRVSLEEQLVSQREREGGEGEGEGRERELLFSPCT